MPNMEERWRKASVAVEESRRFWEKAEPYVEAGYNTTYDDRLGRRVVILTPFSVMDADGNVYYEGP